MGVFLLYDNLSGASFLDSPLVETKDALIFGLGFSYRIWQSDRPAYVEPLKEPGIQSEAGADNKANKPS